MEKSFSVPFGEYKLIGDVLCAGAKQPNILVLHGAGQGNRGRYRVLREFLLRNGLGSYAFDFVGHGETAGSLLGSSLSDRTQQVISVMKEQEIKEPLVLIGASMGAYISIKIAELYSVDSLILMVPGIYARAAYEISFGESFSKEIREDDSWLSSDAWEIISSYRGKLLLIVAELDRVVPREIPQRIFDMAIQAEKKEIYIVPGAPHLLMKYLIENPVYLEIVLGKMLELTA